MANDDRASEACRITALRVAALHGAKEVLPVARELAQTGYRLAKRLGIELPPRHGIVRRRAG